MKKIFLFIPFYNKNRIFLCFLFPFGPPMQQFQFICGCIGKDRAALAGGQIKVVVGKIRPLARFGVAVLEALTRTQCSRAIDEFSGKVVA